MALNRREFVQLAAAMGPRWRGAARLERPPPPGV